jgi:hypothetical protein
LVQVMQLGLRMLIDGRDAHVDGAALHKRRPFFGVTPFFET